VVHQENMNLVFEAPAAFVFEKVILGVFCRSFHNFDFGTRSLMSLFFFFWGLRGCKLYIDRNIPRHGMSQVRVTSHRLLGNTAYGQDMVKTRLMLASANLA
jgi:hypothetical protein